MHWPNWGRSVGTGLLWEPGGPRFDPGRPDHIEQGVPCLLSRSYHLRMSRRRQIVAPLVVGLLAGISLGSTLLFLDLLAHGGGAAFLVFYSAARTLSQGGTPYHIVHGIALDQAFVYLPWVAIVLRPISRMPFWTAFHVWIAISGGLVLLSTWILARTLRWSRWLLLVAGVAFSSILWRCLLTGQIDGFAVALETLALLGAIRQTPAASGALSVAAALLKPQVLWVLPVVLFVALLRRQQGRGFATGGIAAILLLVGVPAVLYPALLIEWARTMRSFASSIASVQPDLAGLPGLLRFAPSSYHLEPSLASPVTLVIVSGGILIIGWLVWRTGTGPTWTRLSETNRLVWAVMLPMGVWFLISPYSHSNDILVLVPLLVVALGRNGYAAHTPAGVVTLAALVTLPEFFLFINPSELIGSRSVASLAVLALVLFAWSRSPWRDSPGENLAAGGSVAAELPVADSGTVGRSGDSRVEGESELSVHGPRDGHPRPEVCPPDDVKVDRIQLDGDPRRRTCPAFTDPGCLGWPIAEDVGVDRDPRWAELLSSKVWAGLWPDS